MADFVYLSQAAACDGTKITIPAIGQKVAPSIEVKTQAECRQNLIFHLF